MISTKKRQSTLPNFLKTVLFAAAAAASLSAFAGHHEKGEKIGELKDMKKSEKTLKTDDMSSTLDTAKKAGAESKEATDMKEKAMELKAEAPES